MVSSIIQDLVERNANYAKSHKPMPFLGELTTPLSTVVVACADPRVWPEKLLHLSAAEAVILRPVGGRITDYVLNEIVTLNTFMGGILTNLIIIHHTDCGASHFKDDQIRSGLSAHHPGKDFSDFRTGSWGDQSIPESVTTDVRIAKAYPLLSDEMKANTVGFVYDIKTGKLTEAPA